MRLFAGACLVGTTCLFILLLVEIGVHYLLQFLQFLRLGRSLEGESHVGVLRLLCLLLLLMLGYFELPLYQFDNVVLLVRKSRKAPDDHEAFPLRPNIIQFVSEADDTGTLPLEARNEKLAEVPAGENVDLLITLVKLGETSYEM